MNNRRTTLQALLGLALLALPTLAFAGTTVQPGDILQVYQNLETQWASNAASIGTDLFGVFAGLEFAWTWITWLLEKGGGDGESVIPTLLKKNPAAVLWLLAGEKCRHRTGPYRHTDQWF